MDTSLVEVENKIRTILKNVTYNEIQCTEESVIINAVIIA